MKKIITYISLLSLSVGLWCGCKTTLEPGGAYSPITVVTNATGTVSTTPDVGLYMADASFAAAHSILDLAFKFEKDNRETLWKLSPEVKHTLDKIRPTASTAVLAYKAARASYIKNPSPVGLEIIDDIVFRIQGVANAASAVIATVNPKAK